MACDQNIAAGNEPYQDVAIRTLGELEWVMKQRSWSSEYDLPDGKERANMKRVFLTFAHLEDSYLREVHLERADLSYAHLEGKRFSDEDFHHVRATKKRIYGIEVPQELPPADICESFFASTTSLRGALLTAKGQGIRLADVRWSGINLAVVNWSAMQSLRDETMHDKPRIGRGRKNHETRV